MEVILNYIEFIIFSALLKENVYTAIFQSEIIKNLNFWKGILSVQNVSCSLYRFIILHKLFFKLRRQLICNDILHMHEMKHIA